MNSIPDVPKEERARANCSATRILCVGGDCPCEKWAESSPGLADRAEKIIAALRERAEKAEKERNEEREARIIAECCYEGQRERAEDLQQVLAKEREKIKPLREALEQVKDTPSCGAAASPGLCSLLGAVLVADEALAATEGKGEKA